MIGKDTKILLIICISTFFTALALSIPRPIFPLYVLTFEVSYLMLGFITSGFGLARVFIDAPIGALINRLGLRRPMLIGTLLFAVGTTISGAASTTYELFVYRLMVGVGASFFFTAALTTVTAIAPPCKGGRFVSYYQLSFILGFAVGPIAGGILANVAGFRPPFFLSSALSLLGGLVLWFAMRAEPAPLETDEGHISRTLAETFSAVFRSRMLLLVNLAAFASMFGGQSLVAVAIPVYGERFLGLDYATVGGLLSAVDLVRAGIVLPSGHLSDKMGRGKLLASGFALVGISSLFYTIGKQYPVLLFSSAVLGLGSGLLGPSRIALLSDLTSEEERGPHIGVMRTSVALGFLASPLITGLLIDLVGIETPFYFVSALSLISALPFLLWAREK